MGQPTIGTVSSSVDTLRKETGQVKQQVEELATEQGQISGQVAEVHDRVGQLQETLAGKESTVSAVLNSEVALANNAQFIQSNTEGHLAGLSQSEGVHVVDASAPIGDVAASDQPSNVVAAFNELPPPNQATVNGRFAVDQAIGESTANINVSSSPSGSTAALPGDDATTISAGQLVGSPQPIHISRVQNPEDVLEFDFDYSPSETGTGTIQVADNAAVDQPIVTSADLGSQSMTFGMKLPDSIAVGDNNTQIISAPIPADELSEITYDAVVNHGEAVDAAVAEKEAVNTSPSDAANVTDDDQPTVTPESDLARFVKSNDFSVSTAVQELDSHVATTEALNPADVVILNGLLNGSRGTGGGRTAEEVAATIDLLLQQPDTLAKLKLEVGSIGLNYESRPNLSALVERITNA